MNQSELVTIVIPTKNSSKYLDIVLESTRKQTYKNVEVIVVDNHSTDNTKEIAKKYTDKIYDKGPERSSQKNFGAKLAKGSYILFLDSDAELTRNVVEECVELIEQNNDMIIIPEKHVGFGFWTKVKALERECFLNDDTVEAPWFFKKSSFLTVGGYNEQMFAGEDWDLFERMKARGFKFTRNKSFIDHHLGYLKFWNMISKKYYYGKNLSLFLDRNKKLFVEKIPFFRVAFFKSWKLLVKHPLLTIGLIFLKLEETASVSLGVINHKLKR
jgi:glycosyltransferase involved in cell wall biosynthesis